MEIRRVRAFRAIVECGSLSRAANVLHLSAGALSKSMRQLEHEVGKRLFMRDGRKLRLTEHGTLLYRVSAGLLEEHNRVLQQLDASTQVNKPTLRLATFEVFASHFLGALLASGLVEHPLHVLELQVGEIERAVAEHEADIGITYVPVPHRGIIFERVGSIRFQIYVKHGAFRDTCFDDLPFAIPAVALNQIISDVLGIDCWPYQRVARLVRYRLTSLESALELCRNGLCAVFMPSFLAGLHNRHQRRAYQIVEFPAPPELPMVERQVHVIYRESESGLADKVIASVHTALQTGINEADK